MNSLKKQNLTFTEDWIENPKELEDDNILSKIEGYITKFVEESNDKGRR